ncbi:MAG: GAF domain-containing sensor histidine kinase [Candidatus Anammoximicrobium sp.]|nr:GAF domain-containing sensor histidine kinase [Candidatus Anammoximicrobium sp.]
MISFQYTQVSDELLHRFVELLETGDSIVLLGPRCVGKKYVLARLVERLLERGSSPIGYVRFFEPGLESFDDQNNATHAEANRLQLLAPDIDMVIDWLRRETGKQAPILFAANVDALPQQRAQRLLREIRNRVKDSSAGKPCLRVILTGEADLTRLVYGPDSQFNCANQFVIQGFAPDVFGPFFHRYTRSWQLAESSRNDETMAALYQRTGGNLYFLRMFLWAAFDWWGHRFMREPEPIDLTAVPDDIVVSHVLASYGPGHARYLTEAVARRPHCWAALERLKRDGELPVERHAPEPLELAGVAVRAEGRLRFACPLVKSLVDRYYTEQRFGDLFASRGNWERAFDYYRAIDPAKRIRPASLDDVGDTEAIVQSLHTSLHAAATRNSEKVLDLFQQGCLYVLGFKAVTFWTHREKWDREQTYGLAQDVSPDLAAAILTAARTGESRLLQLDPIAGQQVLAAAIARRRDDEPRAVIVSDAIGTLAGSVSRQELAKRLLEHFLIAFERAVQMERDRERLAVRDRYSQIVSDIFASLGTTIVNAGQTIQVAARKLRDGGYRRVLFSLIDPTETYVEGVPDDADPTAAEIASKTKWLLADSQQDVQPWVVKHTQSCVIPDATIHPLTNKKIVDAAGIRAMAVVPLLNHNNQPIGTVHVERADGAVPTPDEITDLERFGKELAIAIEQSQRIQMLQSALDKLPEPIVILDRRLRLRYANFPATKYFPVRADWHDREDATRPEYEPPLPQPLEVGCECLADAQKSLQQDTRIVRHRRYREHELDHRVVSLTQVVRDWRKEMIAVLCHIEDITFLARVFAALELVQKATDVDSICDVTLQAMRVLGHTWGRLYRYATPDGRGQFVSNRCFGQMDEGLKKRFDGGDIRLPPRTEPGEAYLAVDERQPLVFCRRDDLTDGIVHVTELGLEARNVICSRCPSGLDKHVGDVWIDFPLRTRSKIVGKITLQCPKNFPPESFEFIKLLCEMITGLLEACELREREFADKQRWIEQAAENAIRDTAHHIRTRLGSMPLFHDEFKRIAEALPEGQLRTELNEVTMKFQHLCQSISRLIDETRDRLAPVEQVIRANLQQVELAPLIRGSLRAALPNTSIAVVDPPEPLFLLANATMLDRVFTELATNSMTCFNKMTKLEVDVTVKCIQTDTGDLVAVVEYCDNGPGVPTEFKERIFENFFSRHPNKLPGTGLGLCFVRKVVAAHHGDLQEVGTPGQGACFVIRLPLERLVLQKETE